MSREKPVVIPKEYYVPNRMIVKEGNRFKIYLPMNMNKLWSVLRSRKVDIYIIVVDEGDK